MPARINNPTHFIGRVFGRLTVIAFAGRRGPRKNQFYWRCRCVCGGLKDVNRGNLNTGDVKSCGCLRKEVSSRIKNPTIHHPEYLRWKGMLKRCEYPKDQSYKHYGGRGIKVCKRWHKFENFLADMGCAPSPLHSLGRKNNDGDYKPSNVFWETPEEQGSNTRATRLVTAFCKTLSVKQWSRLTGIGASTIYRRLDNLVGGTVENALTKPPRHGRNAENWK